MKKTLASLFVLLSIPFWAAAQNGSKGTQAPQVGSVKWSIDPFEHALFVENKGQFDTVMPGEQILFEAKLGSINAFFTAKGIMYSHMETEKLDFSNGKDPDQNGPPKRSFYYLNTAWEGANAGVTVDADEKQSYYYTYPKGTNNTYVANVFKKITYHNLYPGIDVVYSFPDGKNNLEYTIVVHPGANPELVHIKYGKSAWMKVNNKGNVVVKNDIGTLTESAPVSYYLEDHEKANVSSKVNSPVESFVAKNIDASKTLIIDPIIIWTTNPNFISTSGSDYAFDLDWDSVGNVYAYGGGPTPLQLIKLNAAGVIQWTFNATTMTSSTNFYGDFAVDKHSQECYTVEGWNAGGGARIEKVSPAGLLLGTDPGTAGFNEMWRIVNSVCPPAFEIFGNGTCCPQQAAMLDTTMATVTAVNILGAAIITGYHDMALCAADPMGGSAWTATTQSLSFIPVLNNYLVKCPIPALTPNTYCVPDQFAFKEIASMNYTPSLVFNAMNGLACGADWLYAYNGDTLKQISKATGAINAVVSVSNTLYTWGGLDVDLCQNIYVGNNTSIQIYNPSLALISTLPVLKDTIYDLSVAPYQSQLVYACGRGYVSAISLGLPIPNAVTITRIPSNCSSCSGTAKATLMLCGSPDTIGVTYRWSDGQTTRTATALCSGVDTVTVTVECEVIFKDTVTIPVVSGAIVITRDSTNFSCLSPGSAAVGVSGGHPPFTYNWSNGSTTSGTGPVSAGVYCVGIKDQHGCFDSLCITVSGTLLPTITITPPKDSICAGNSVALTAAGGVSYIWAPATGLSCTACANPTASPLVTTTYTVTGTDAGGCKNKDSVVIKVFPLPVITVTPANGTVCPGGAVTLTAAGALTYSWAPSTGLSCTNCASPTANPAATTNYTVIGKDANGCSNANNVTVTVETPPTLSVSASPSMICAGGSTTLLTSSSGVTSSFVWQPGALTGPSVIVSPTTTTTYTVTASNACGTASQSITINVNPLPVPQFSADITQGCSPLCIQFRDLSTLSSGKISQWRWKFGDGDTLNAENPIYCYPNPGNFTVNLTTVSDSGCSASLKILNMITVYSHPVANFIASPQPTTILEPAIKFTDKSTDAYGISGWFWTYGDGDSVNTTQNPTHSYRDTGTYCAKLVVMNMYGCTDTLKNCLVIDPIFALYIPDAFSPNGSGINDIFLPKGNDIKSFEMYIFDRWGMQLFHSTDITTGWNGKANASNTTCQEDTYVYIITVTDNKNTKHNYTGNVTLIK